MLACLALAGLLFALSSCAPRSVRPAAELSPYEGPVTVEVLKDFVVFKKTRTLRSELDVKVISANGRTGRLSGVLLYEYPHNVRLRLYDPFGTTVVDAVHAEGLLQLYLPLKRYLYEEATPVVDGGLSYSMEENEEEDEYALNVFARAGGSRVILARHVFDHRTLRQKSVYVYRRGENFLRIVLAESSGELPLAARLDLYGGYSMELRLIDPEPGADLPLEAFWPITHDGKRVLPLRLLEPSRL